MKRSLLIIGLIWIITFSSFGQTSESALNKVRELQAITQVLSQGNTDSGVLIGLRLLKTLRNDRIRSGWRVLIGIDKMERTPQAPIHFFEFSRMINVGYELQTPLIKGQHLKLWIHGLVGLTVMKESTLGPDTESEGLVGYFSLEPGLSISYQVHNRWNLFLGNSYLLRTESSELVDFSKLSWNFGVGFKL